MKRLKYRRTAESATHQDHWKNFTDIFATVCLMFFFVMVVFGILSSFLGNEARVLEADLLARQAELAIHELALAELTDTLDDMQRVLFEERAELIRATLALEELEALFRQHQLTQIAAMQAARVDFERIAAYRIEMYRRIESMLQEVLGDQIFFDEAAGVLVFDTNFLFPTGVWEVPGEHVETIRRMSPYLFQIIREYTRPDSLVRFESFEFRGHTDHVGTGHSERVLSQRRARSIVNLILPVGSPEEAQFGQYFIASGASMFQPIAGTVQDQTPEERTLNRRVEIIINFDDRDIEQAIAQIAETLITPGVADILPDDGTNFIEQPWLD